MKKAQLATRLARQAGVTRAEAADRLDRVVNHILKQVRKGASVQIPGLGEFLAGREGKPQFKPTAEKGASRHGR